MSKRISLTFEVDGRKVTLTPDQADQFVKFARCSYWVYTRSMTTRMHGVFISNKWGHDAGGDERCVYLTAFGEHLADEVYWRLHGKTPTL